MAETPADRLADAVEEFIAVTGDMPDIHEQVVPLIDAWVTYNETPTEATLAQRRRENVFLCTPDEPLPEQAGGAVSSEGGTECPSGFEE